MSTIVKEVVIPNNHRVNLDVEVPSDIPAGDAVITMIFEPRSTGKKHRNKIGDLFGKGKGEIWMSDDFDAPLEDFKEYM